MTDLVTLPTPCLVLDRGILEQNLQEMRLAVTRHGVALRPHLKTAKSTHVAQLATGGGSSGITVSTIAEAEYFTDNGYDDILLAVSLTPDKLQRLALLVERDITCTVVTDDVGMATAIGESGLPLRALIEIDCGECRSGILPRSESLLAIADALGATFAGVMTHAGHSYQGRSRADFERIAEEERDAVVTAAERLRESGREVPIVSVGSTPTALHARHLDGVTEMRAGVYMFGDLFQAAIGSCTEEQIALTVLASVIGRRVEEGKLLLDAGALALSKDRSTAQTDHDAGFGIVWDIDGEPAFGHAWIEKVYQEHGIAVCSGRWPWDDLPIGARVRIAPNHACLTAAAHDCYHVVDGGREVVAEWGRCRGW